MKQILIASYSLIAAVSGAGFASGQEIMCYFARFGRAGILGIAVFAAVFALFSFAVMYTAGRIRAESFDSFLDIFPGKALRNIIKWSVGIFSFAVYAVMIAAAGGIGAMLTPFPPSLCALVCAACCALLLCRGAEGAFRLNGVFGIFLTAGIVTCCFYILRYREHHVFAQTAAAVSDSFIYSGYNLISLTPVMAVFGLKLKDPRCAAAVSVISAAAMFLMTSLMFALLSMYANRVELGEFPMLTLAFRQNKTVGTFYYVMIATAVITTLLSSGGSVAGAFRFDKRRMPIFMMTAAAYLISGAGFGRLVDTAYRFCGIAGGILTAVIVFFCIRASFMAGKEKLNQKI